MHGLTDFRQGQIGPADNARHPGSGLFGGQDALLRQPMHAHRTDSQHRCRFFLRQQPALLFLRCIEGRDAVTFAQCADRACRPTSFAAGHPMAVEDPRHCFVIAHCAQRADRRFGFHLLRMAAAGAARRATARGGRP